MNIIFGKPTVTREIIEKYNDLAVVTVEAVKGAKKSRRTIFNKSAIAELDLEKGVTNSIMFGWVTDGENKFVIIANTTGLAEQPTDVVFKTSRNFVSWGADDEYKGKAISSGQLVKHIDSHLGASTEEREYVLVPFKSPEATDLGYDLFEFIPMDSYVNETEVEEEVEFATPSIEEEVVSPEPMSSIEETEVTIENNSTQGVTNYF